MEFDGPGPASVRAFTLATYAPHAVNEDFVILVAVRLSGAPEQFAFSLQISKS